MSMESANAFMERMKTDEDFVKKVTACKDAETRMALILSEGFDCTREELLKVASQLTDEDLDAVAGGGPNLWKCIASFYEWLTNQPVAH